MTTIRPNASISVEAAQEAALEEALRTGDTEMARFHTALLMESSYTPDEIEDSTVRPSQAPTPAEAKMLSVKKNRKGGTWKIRK